MFENLKTWLRNLFTENCEHDYKMACSRVVRDAYGKRHIEYSLVCKNCGREISRYIGVTQEYPVEMLELAANHNRPIGYKSLW